MIIGGVCVSRQAGYFHLRVGVYFMYYQICPRCQFRSPATKAVCATCGKQLPKETAAKPQDTAASRMASTRAPKPSFWKSMFGIADTVEAGEKAHDEPALGET